MKELIEIQKMLKAPKSQFNKFGNYKYRSCEDIIEAAKPIYTALGCYLTLTDEVITRADQPDLLIATATITNSEGKTVTVKGNGAIDYEKKGMDYSQIIGAASSYARKYALNGLFAIDDTKDADATNTHDVDVKPKRTSKAKEQVEETPVPEQAQEPTPEPPTPAVDAEIEYAIHGCATREELKALMNSQPDWSKDDAIRDMANKYFYELKN